MRIRVEDLRETINKEIEKKEPIRDKELNK